MEGAASDHRVAMGSMDVGWSDLGLWTQLLAAIGGTGTGRVDPAERGGEATAARPRRRACRRPARRRAGPRDILAQSPVALLAGAAAAPRARRGARGPRRRMGGTPVTERARRTPAKSPIVFGTDGWRARIAEDYTFENVRRCADGVARYVVGRGRAGQGRRHRLRPPLRLGALRDGDGRGDPRPRHPGRVRGARRAHPDELLRGRRAGRVGGHRDHGQPQPMDRQRLQGQVAARARRAARTCSRSSRRRSPQGAPIERRPFAEAEAAGLVERFDPYEGYERFVRRTVDLDALKAADDDVLVEPMWGAGAGWMSRAPGRWRDPRHRDPPGAQPVLRRREPRADPAERRRGARQDRARRPRAGAAPRRRRGSRRRGRRAGHVHPPARGHRPADVLPRRASRPARAGGRLGQQHVDGGAPRRSTTASRSTRARSATSSSAR